MKTKPITFLLSFSFLFLFSGSVYGEEPEVKREYYDSGKLKKETHYKNGKQEGLRTGWYENGRKEYIKHYKNGKENGIRKEWDENGRLIFEGNFIDGAKEIQ